MGLDFCFSLPIFVAPLQDNFQAYTRGLIVQHKSLDLVKNHLPLIGLGNLRFRDIGGSKSADGKTMLSKNLAEKEGEGWEL